MTLYAAFINAQISIFTDDKTDLLKAHGRL